MLQYAIVFFIIALIAAFLGFTGLAAVYRAGSRRRWQRQNTVRGFSGDGCRDFYRQSGSRALGVSACQMIRRGWTEKGAT